MLVFVSLHGFINVYLSCTWKTSPLLLKAYLCHYVGYVFVSVCVCVSVLSSKAATYGQYALCSRMSHWL